MVSGVSVADNVAYSDDNGATWTGPTNVGVYTSFSASSGAILQHSSGVLIRPNYGENSGDTLTRAAVQISSDDGVTWGANIYLTAANSNTNEITLVELVNGVVLAFVRVEGVTNGVAIKTSKSLNAGVSWSGLTNIGFNSYSSRPTGILFPAAEAILLLYRRANDAAAVYRLSNDNGATWSAEQVWSAGVLQYAGGIASGPYEVVLGIGLGAGDASWLVAVCQLGTP